MALTQVDDVIVPEVFASYSQLLTTTKSAFVQSGVIVRDPALDVFLAGGGTTINFPSFNDLADDESNVSTDEAVTVNDADPLKTGTSRDIAIRLSRNQHWSGADLARDLAGADPMDSIASRVNAYWLRQEQLTLIAEVQGLIADNIITDASDMLNDDTTGGTPDASNLFSAEGFIDTAQTMGDAAEALGVVAMHSVVHSRALKNDLIDFIPDSDGKMTIETFQGRRVVVDDGLPAIVNGGNIEYSTYLFGVGSIGQGVGSARVPVEVTREALAGQGGGQEILSTRRETTLHPYGFRFLEAGIALQSPTNTEMAAAAQWLRSVERKLVRIAEYRTNG